MDVYGGDKTAVPIVEYFGDKLTTPLDNIRRVDGTLSSSSPSTLSDADPWLRLLASETYLPGYALFTRYVFVQGNKFQDNPRRNISAPAHVMMVKITKARDPAKAWTINTVEGNNHSNGCYIKTIGIRISEEKEILIDLIEEYTTRGELVSLPLSFRYHPETGSASVCQSLKKGDIVETRAQMNAILNPTFRDMVEVYRTISRDAAVLPSKEWFPLGDPDTEPLGKTLMFRLLGFIRFQDERIFSSVETLGHVPVELPTEEVVLVASLRRITGQVHRNPVVDYLQPHGTSVKQPVNFESAIPLTRKLNFPPEPRLATSDMAITALLNDDIKTKFRHAGMVSGRKMVRFKATNKETREKVLVGEVEAEQPVSAYMFASKGSQEQDILWAILVS
ncbi:hypothetical protein C7212DRAFT_362057 [Tuber magnatum]|uniref:Fatty acid synthase meander beta sheet domain-containing protein n=1 Tax=Tuber magnatum TaxID=42249 RepID=A0A317SZ72_9PEZI|nr:hypothetical protein C7212DRAFT_362057 [Tuber magnatum]